MTCEVQLYTFWMDEVSMLASMEAGRAWLVGLVLSQAASGTCRPARAGRPSEVCHDAVVCAAAGGVCGAHMGSQSALPESLRMCSGVIEWECKVKSIVTVRSVGSSIQYKLLG